MVIKKLFYASHGVRDSVARMIQEGFNLPEPKRHHLEPLGETLNVYDSRVIFKAIVRNSRKKAFAVHARLEYQACDEKECYLPESIDFELSLTYLFRGSFLVAVSHDK